MSLFGDAPRFGKGISGTLLGGEVFVDVLPQTQSSVGPGSYNTGPRVKKVAAPKITRSESVPKTPRRWNQPQVQSQESRLAMSMTMSPSGSQPSHRHSYLYSVMNNGVEIFRSDVGLIPGPGAYTGNIVGQWEEQRKKNRTQAAAAAATATQRGLSPSRSRFITSTERPDANMLATAVVRHDVLFVHKTPSTPGPGMYSRLYDRKSPWISRSFNVRVRSGNSPVRARPQGEATRVDGSSSNRDRRSTTPQPSSARDSARRGASPSDHGFYTDRPQQQRSHSVGRSQTSSSKANQQYPHQPSPRTGYQQQQQRQHHQSEEQQESLLLTSHMRGRERRMSTRTKELENWWDQVSRRTYSPRQSTIRSPRAA